MRLWPKWYNPIRRVRTIYDIARTASRLSGYSVEQIIGPQRHSELVHVRFAVCAVAHTHGYSYPRIGVRLGNRDHTTIIHAVKKAAQIRKTDPEFNELLSTLAAECAA